MRILLRCLAAALALACCLACFPVLSEEGEFVDYAAQLTLDPQSDTLKLEVTVKAFVDGDTTHFCVPESVEPSGVFKARYLACNTPESTGKIEEWGKKAARFTREKLESAESILIESDNGQWNPDSTGTRYLVWVWYCPAGEHQYRNLNLELLQNGLAIANSSAQNRYGDACMAAIAQARAHKLHVYSGEKDPDFFYGDAIELTIRELRLHPEAYDGMKVAFNGIITVNHSNSVFLEDYDPETDLYFGISAYYGFNLSGGGLEVLHVGNEARIVGTMQYYEAGHIWQVSGLNYRMMKPKDPGNIQKLSEGHAPSWKETDPATLRSAVTVETESGPETFDYAYLALDTTVNLKNLTVISQGTDEDESSHRLICSGDTPDELRVYLPFTRDEAEQRLGALQNRTIDVRGIVSQDRDGQYCIRVYTSDGLTIHDD